MARLNLERSVTVERPVEVVRAHFLDFEHHIRANVHRSITYTLLPSDPGQQHVRQQFKVLGLPKRDEVIVELNPEGHVLQTFEIGDFAGGTVLFRLSPLGDSQTRITAEVDAPLRGLNRLLAPLLHRVVARLVETGLEEDRRDLQTYRSAS